MRYTYKCSVARIYSRTHLSQTFLILSCFGQIAICQFRSMENQVKDI